MGFAVASKGVPLAGLLKKFLLAAPAASALGPRSVAGGCRLFNSGPPQRRDESNVDNSVVSNSRLPSTFSDPQEFGHDTLVERGFWVSKDDDDVMELTVAMKDMAKEQVKLLAYKDALLVKWEDVVGSDGDEDPAWYTCRISLSAVGFKLDQTKAEMKNGLLTITVPRIKGKVVQECTYIKID